MAVDVVVAEGVGLGVAVARRVAVALAFGTPVEASVGREGGLEAGAGVALGWTD